jgi:hypothetical protein
MGGAKILISQTGQRYGQNGKFVSIC